MESRAARVRRLFGQALERPAEERGSWLRSTESDSRVVREVEALLDADAATEALDRALGVVAANDPTAGLGAALSPGDRLGRYTLVAEAGRGATGVVWRAHDESLDRAVAIKVLNPALAAELSRRSRFVREARAAAALDHPAICPVHEIVEPDDGPPYLVAGWIEGETLRERLRRGPLPVAEVVDIAVQVASGLAAAHAAGIVHRDVKPANIMLDPGGRVRILDFGVAKLPDADVTRTGAILGTVSAMSPEQVRGERVDSRSDIWALGILVYEMVAGRPPFRGDRAEAVARAIVEDDPPPLTAVRTGVPPDLDRIVAKLLAKDPAHRYQHVDEVPVDLRALVLDEGGISAARRVGPATPVLASRGALLVGLVGAAAVGAWAHAALSPSEGGSPAADVPTLRFEVALPPGARLNAWYQPLALSPDGERLVYGATEGATSEEGASLWLRTMDRADARPVPGTEGGQTPFFSPSGRRLGFFAGGRLMTTDLTSGRAQAVASVDGVPQGASWGSDDDIVFASGVTTGLFRVPADGGPMESLTEPDSERGEIGHAWPQHLPGGALLFTIWSDRGFRTAFLPAADSAWRIVYEGAAAARYVETGHLVMAEMLGASAEPGLLAAPFDLERGEVTGPVRSVLGDRGIAGPNFAVADNGTLVYVAGGSPAWAGLNRNRLVWIDASGAEELALADEGFFETPRLSPDGRRVAVSDFSPGGTYDVWIHDLERGTRLRLSREAALNNSPVWSLDGSRVVFASTRAPAGLYAGSADGSGEVDRLWARGAGRIAVSGSWSPDGETLLYTVFEGAVGGDIWRLDREGGGEPITWLATDARELAPAWSPTGDLVAYASDVSGRMEVYVRAPDDGEAVTIVSPDGGREPVWARDGRTLYFRSDDAIMAAPVGTQGGGDLVGRAREIARARVPLSSFGLPNYDVAPDGRILAVVPLDETPPTHLAVVVGWFDELRRRAAGDPSDRTGTGDGRE